jgi:hypothetical protein
MLKSLGYVGTIPGLTTQFWRAGVPRSTADGETLRKIGIHEVIRCFALDESPTWEEEEDFISPIPLVYSVGDGMAIADWAIQTVDMIATFLKGGETVLAHCENGKNRTGVLVAGFRVKYQNWPIDKAVAEFVANDGSHILRVFDDPSLERILRRVLALS